MKNAKSAVQELSGFQEILIFCVRNEIIFEVIINGENEDPSYPLKKVRGEKNLRGFSRDMQDIPYNRKICIRSKCVGRLKISFSNMLIFKHRAWSSGHSNLGFHQAPCARRFAS